MSTLMDQLKQQLDAIQGEIDQVSQAGHSVQVILNAGGKQLDPKLTIYFRGVVPRR